MLSEITTTVLSLFHVLGLIAMLIGVFYLLTAMLGARGADGYIKGGACIFLGAWIGHLGEPERPSILPGRAHRAHILMTAAPGALPPACRNSQPAGALVRIV
jgi:hypothetical protein